MASVRINIVGGFSGAEPVEYDTGASTSVVKEDLIKAYGPGILKRADGKGVSASSLDAGEYSFHFHFLQFNPE